MVNIVYKFIFLKFLLFFGIFQSPYQRPTASPRTGHWAFTVPTTSCSAARTANSGSISSPRRNISSRKNGPFPWTTWAAPPTALPLRRRCARTTTVTTNARRPVRPLPGVPPFFRLPPPATRHHPLIWREDNNTRGPCTASQTNTRLHNSRPDGWWSNASGLRVRFPNVRPAKSLSGVKRGEESEPVDSIISCSAQCFFPLVDSFVRTTMMCQISLRLSRDEKTWTGLYFDWFGSEMLASCNRKGLKKGTDKVAKCERWTPRSKTRHRARARVCVCDT